MEELNGKRGGVFKVEYQCTARKTELTSDLDW